MISISLAFLYAAGKQVSAEGLPEGLRHVSQTVRHVSQTVGFQTENP